jgi:hypothetical protein
MSGLLRLQTLGAISLEGADQLRLTSRRKELVLLTFLARRGGSPFYSQGVERFRYVGLLAGLGRTRPRVRSGGGR